MIRPELIRKLIQDLFGPEYAERIEKLRIDEPVIKMIVEMVDSLPDRQKVAICVHYGITELPKDIGTLGAALGRVKDPSIPISKERVRCVIARGLRQLRHPMRIERLGNLILAISN